MRTPQIDKTIEQIGKLPDDEAISSHDGFPNKAILCTTDDLKQLVEYINQQSAALDLANRKNAILRDGLEHYADRNHWYWSEHECADAYDNEGKDGTEIAIAKLAEAESVGEI